MVPELAEKRWAQEKIEQSKKKQHWIIGTFLFVLLIALIVTCSVAVG